MFLLCMHRCFVVFAVEDVTFLFLSFFSWTTVDALILIANVIVVIWLSFFVIVFSSLFVPKEVVQFLID